METSKFVKGALILTFSGLIGKLLSAGYRIPLQNLTGDIGFYIYQQVYPILGIAGVLALYGFPSAISKLTAEREGISTKQFIIPIVLLLMGICGLLSLFLFVNAENLAMFVGDERLISAYQISSFILLLIPFSALLRGIYQGNSNMAPTAYSQLGEQLIRVLIIIAAAIIVTRFGYDVYLIGNFAAIASFMGILTGIIILLLFLGKHRPIMVQQTTIPWKYYWKTILVFGLVGSLSHMILLIIQFADSFTVVPALIEYGYSQREAMEAKGIFDRGQPLLQIGAVLGSSFGLALIPSIAKARVFRDSSEIQKEVSSSLKVSFYLAWAATIGLIVLFPEVNRLLYQDNKGDEALTFLMIAVLLSSLVITTSSILQGIGYLKWTAYFIIGAFMIKWLLNLLLVPRYGILGSSISTILSLLFLFVLTIMMVKRVYSKKRLIMINRKAFILASIGMITFLLLVCRIFPSDTYSRFPLLIYVLFNSIIGAGIYLTLLFRFGAFTNKEISLLPFGSKWLQRYRRSR
ncbi:putative polysaccharide biosynthesis protein [Ornithinibacillus scapharcae]|uniref:putative polysaccharide biosynthesis protein n=1 Tax=Ornithinibacillus scapharcae TaxID=1147159 RepID=UPI000225AAB1|nr:polysaccharide biosynthesis protein [Ornithinibacillus scapharcae]